MIENYDQTLKVLFLGYTIENTLALNQIKRSIYGKRCDVFNDFLEYEGQLCYIAAW